jgi:eukaryotic-like serine/threonine-protein kinase
MRGIATKERFDRRRPLGGGAFGEVWEAYDRERRELVALKSLIRADAEAIYRFKQEFRALADIRHPNLVTLHELLNEGNEWLLVMELVQGVDFATYVRPEAASANEDTLRAEDGRVSEVHLARTLLASGTGPCLPADMGRLRTALTGLVEGVLALHAHGKLHRDLKPSNVIVTPEGRVVLLDFGLVAESRADAVRATAIGTVIGTPAYMAPEQLRGECTGASDAYAVGVMLFEAVTGALPFDGAPLEILVKKQSADGPAPASIVKDVPQDLDAMIGALLRLDPAARPALTSVLQAFAPDRDSSSSVGAAPEIFLGREDEIAVLDRALDAVQRGEARTVFVRGLAGMGKTALVRAFLEEKARPRGALVLEGRCYEHESVPYKALDGVVDKLAAHLRGLRADVLADSLSSQLEEIAPLFPVLAGVTRRAAAPAPDADAKREARAVRARAFCALRDVLHLLSQHRPLVLFVDALQWGDIDSVPFFGEAVRAPDAPRVLIVLAYRTEEEDRSDVVRQLRRQKGDLFRRASGVETLDVAPLPIETSSRLASALVGHGEGDRNVAEAIAKESGGSPLLLQELVRHAREEHVVTSAGSTRNLGLQEMLAYRTDRLPLACRHLLEIVCVAGFPMRAAVAVRAAGVSHAGKAEIRTLCDRRLLRVRTARGEELVEPFHDRIRETVAGNLGTAEIAAWHRAIAGALEHHGEEGERLARELLLAGFPDRARAKLVAAAARAESALAFQRAASLYQLALAAGKTSGEERSRLYERMANALVECGRGHEAALAYRRAATGQSSEGEGLRLRRIAAEQFLRSGHLREGLTSLREVLRSFRLWFPPMPLLLLLALALGRARLRLRGTRFVARKESEIDGASLARADAALAAGMGLSVIDPALGVYFQMRFFLLALAMGEPSRIGRGLALEAMFSALEGRKTRRRTQRLQEQIAELTQTSEDRIVMAWGLASKGAATYFEGRFLRAAELLAEADRFAREQVRSEMWIRGNCQTFLLWAHAYRGNWAEVLTSLPDYVRDAEDRGDRLTAANLRMAQSTVAWLVRDDPEGAEREIDAAMDGWPRARFCTQHWYELTARVSIDLYSGDGAAALRRCEEARPALRRAMFLGIELVRVELAYAHGRAALACLAAVTGDARAGRATAEREAQALEREPSDMSRSLARLLRAALAFREGRIEAALRALTESEKGFTECGLQDYAMAARRRRGEMLRSDEGAALIEEADRSFRFRGILRPDRFTEMLAPGFGPAFPRIDQGQE